MSSYINKLGSKAKQLLLGKAKDLHDPHIFHKLSLVAFFAWVGLGADGLSSSCYGPEEAFLALNGHIFLGIFVAIATAATVFIISASYSQIVELFPDGGGGYFVASKLLSPSVGMVSGCALLIDYVLTITLSIASGADAIFSFLPYELHNFKLSFAIFGLFVIILLNLRGVKESVLPLIPVFLTFLITHVITIGYAISTHFKSFPTIATSAVSDFQQTSSELGIFGTMLLLLRAYSFGAGTYTGIEAVSNGLPILREPKVKTAKRTMLYMATSLAFMAMGLMVAYVLFRVQHTPGKTLNAVLINSITASWNPKIGYLFVLVTLFSEAILLFVAAQTGFLDGPRVLANMAVDRWFPTHFSLLSERFIIKYGITLMGIFSLILMITTRGSVKFLVILYSINVFITFCLSQTGMVKHWWQTRATSPHWRKKLAINGVGLILTSCILVFVIILKFNEGGWITLVVTGSLIAIAVSIKNYYRRTQHHLNRLDRLVHAVESSMKKASQENKPVPVYNKNYKNAVILVNGFNGMGLHTLFNVRRLFGDNFKNFFFIEAGVVDTDHFKGKDAIKDLETKVNADLARYESFMKSQDLFAKTFPAIGTDVADVIYNTAKDVYQEYPNSVFFCGQIVFKEETLLDRILYNRVAFAVQRRLHQEGIPFIIMPMKVG